MLLVTYKAVNAVTIIQREASAGHLSNPEIVSDLLELLAEESDAEPRDLPDDIIKKLARDIAHLVASQKDRE